MPRIPTLLMAITLTLGPAAQADEPSAAHDPDQRAVITMDPAARHLVLAEMRLFLEGVQKITAGLGEDDLEAAARAARALGLGMTEAVPPQVMQQLPMEFRQLGRSTHADFDQIAMDLETMGDPQHALRQLGGTLQKCIGCHATWRIETGPIETARIGPDPSAQTSRP